MLKCPLANISIVRFVLFFNHGNVVRMFTPCNKKEWAIGFVNIHCSGFNPYSFPFEVCVRVRGFS